MVVARCWLRRGGRVSSRGKYPNRCQVFKSTMPPHVATVDLVTRWINARSSGVGGVDLLEFLVTQRGAEPRIGRPMDRRHTRRSCVESRQGGPCRKYTFGPARLQGVTGMCQRPHPTPELVPKTTCTVVAATRRFRTLPQRVPSRQGRLVSWLPQRAHIKVGMPVSVRWAKSSMPSSMSLTR
jgi:hypothetical protein